MAHSAPLDANNDQTLSGNAGFSGPIGAMAPIELSDVERRFQAIERMATLGELTGGIVHSLRNVLAIVDSAIRRADASSEGSDETHACILGAREGVQRGLLLTAQLPELLQNSKLPIFAGGM